MRDQSDQRRCGKPNCTAPAAASLSFRYATSEVWVLDLAEPHPSRYDLCRPHAEQLTVPLGWVCVDERTASVQSIAPAYADDEEAWQQMAVGDGHRGPPARASGGPAGGGGRNRYAELSAELPRLAAEAGVGGDPDAERGAADPEASPRTPPPMASRDLAPMPPGVSGGVVLAFDRDRERRQGDRDPHAADPGGPDDDPLPPGTG